MIGCLALAAWGCTSLKDGAREEFSSTYSCPSAQIELAKRDDVKPHDLIFGSRPAPPGEVARDPQRLALWEQKQQKLEDDWNNGAEVWEARGCGHDVVYACSRAQTHASTSSGIICSEGKHPPGK